MAIDVDILKLSVLSHAVKNTYARHVQKVTSYASPMTRFMTDVEFDNGYDASGSMVIALRSSGARPVTIGDLTTHEWPNAERPYGKQLKISSSDMRELMGTLKIELKSQSVLRKKGSSIDDQLREQMLDLVEDVKRKSAMLTLLPSTGRLGSVTTALNSTATYVQLDTGWLHNLIYPGMHLCGDDPGSGTDRPAGAIEWELIVSKVDRINRRVYFQTYPTVAGSRTALGSEILAAGDGVWLHMGSNTLSVGTAALGMYSASTWMGADFKAYSLTGTEHAGSASWQFFNPVLRSGGTATVTLSMLENSLLDMQIQSQVVPDMGLCSPAVFKTVANLEDVKKRLNIDPGKKDIDFMLGYNRIWIQAGTGQVPLVPDPCFYDDRIYFLHRAGWKRILLEPWHFEDRATGAGIWGLDDKHGFRKANGWASWNFICMEPHKQLSLYNITA